jgi:membrane protein insertase Oxa1/YidC/SpoIIIJ
MMYGMPVMFTVFMLQMPSGLVLYILTNSVLTLFQTLVINKRTISL